MAEEADDNWESYESGPFCPHWGDPSDCDEPCGTCGHPCSLHGSGECRSEECSCEGFVEPKDDDESDTT